MSIVVVIVIGILAMLVNQGVKSASKESKKTWGNIGNTKSLMSEVRKRFEEPERTENRAEAFSEKKTMRPVITARETEPARPKNISTKTVIEKQENFMRFKNKRKLAEAFMLSEVLNKPRALNPHQSAKLYKNHRSQK
jgi:hypothetical protein